MIYLATLIAILLSIASIFIGYQIKNKPTAERINNKKRLFSWWVIFAVCLIVFLLASLYGPIVVLLFINILLYWIIFELCGLFKKAIMRKNIILFSAVLLAFNLLLLWYPQQSRILFFVAIAVALLIYLTPITSSNYFPLFSLYCCLSLFSIGLISQLSKHAQLDYVFLLLIFFFMTAVNDIAQYISGKLFGKSAIAPKLSPKKTVSGVWGGILASAFLGIILFPRVLMISNLEAFAIGSLLSFAGLFGDLIVSKLKRGLQIKHSGNSISGHGGILDRMDSLLLATPVLGIVLLSGGHL